MASRFANPLFKKTLFVLGNLAACTVVVHLFMVPAYELFGDRDMRISDKRDQLARLKAIAAQGDYVRSLEVGTREQMQAGEFLTGASENVIVADLQTRLKAIAEAAGAPSRAVQSLPVRTTEQIRYIGSRIEIHGPIQAIQRAVHAVESAKPYLFVKAAVIRVAPSNRPGVSGEPVIQAQLDVFGATQTKVREP
jgi:general secretion pathway protein M